MKKRVLGRDGFKASIGGDYGTGSLSFRTALATVRCNDHGSWLLVLSKKQQIFLFLIFVTKSGLLRIRFVLTVDVYITRTHTFKV